MNRGRGGEKIFLSRHDYETFINILKETSDGWNLKISAYCLLPNRYHLLVHTPDGNISRCMRHVNGIYTQRFNRYHKKDGPLFRGRYKAILVDADSYLLEVLRYIHKTPLRAGVAEELSDFFWCSHEGYLSKAKKWEWLYKDLLLSMFSRKKSKHRSVYIDFVSQREPEEIERFYALKNFPSVLGGDSFKEWVREKFDYLLFKSEIPASRQLALLPEKIISVVCNHFKVKKEQLLISQRGRENLPRDIAIYLVRHHSRETLADVGRHFGISNYSTASSAVERIKGRKENDPSLRKDLQKIDKKLGKRQRQP